MPGWIWQHWQAVRLLKLAKMKKKRAEMSGKSIFMGARALSAGKVVPREVDGKVHGEMWSKNRNVWLDWRFEEFSDLDFFLELLRIFKEVDGKVNVKIWNSNLVKFTLRDFRINLFQQFKIFLSKTHQIWFLKYFKSCTDIRKPRNINKKSVHQSLHSHVTCF